MHCEVTTCSPHQTRRLGMDFVRVLGPGVAAALVSDLGGGKTVFVKGMAMGLDVKDPEEVRSPTFTIIHRHDTPRGPFYHADLYRLRDTDEARDIGLEEILGSPATVAVEWADRAPDLFDRAAVWVHLDITGETARRIRFSCGEEATMERLTRYFSAVSS